MNGRLGRLPNRQGKILLLLTPAHIAEIMRMSLQHMRKICKTGMLPAVQAGKSCWYVPKQHFIDYLTNDSEQ